VTIHTLRIWLFAQTNSPWLANFLRRVQDDGYKYNYKSRNIHTPIPIGVLPDGIVTLVLRLQDNNLMNIRNLAFSHL
jgi:hypothetical protein